MRGVAALRCAEDFVADFVFGCGGGGGRGDDGAGELGAGDPGEGRLVLVLAADLEEVEEVCGRGVDGDEVFVCFGRGRVEGDYFEVVRALGMSVWELEYLGSESNTLTYSLI